MTYPKLPRQTQMHRDYSRDMRRAASRSKTLSRLLDLRLDADWRRVRLRGDLRLVPGSEAQR